MRHEPEYGVIRFSKRKHSMGTQAILCAHTTTSPNHRARAGLAVVSLRISPPKRNRAGMPTDTDTMGQEKSHSFRFGTANPRSTQTFLPSHNRSPEGSGEDVVKRRGRVPGR
jgi:hypothetical protein